MKRLVKTLLTLAWQALSALGRAVDALHERAKRVDGVTSSSG